MKYSLLTLALAFITIISPCRSQFVAPESVAYDDYDGSYYVSDAGAGKIYKIDSNRTVTEFASGLTQPKGMAVGMLSLWVANVDKLVEIDLLTGDILNRHSIPDAQFLNDIAKDELGNLYITDTQAFKIYKYNSMNKEISELTSDIPSPNGVLFDYISSALIVVSFRQNARIFTVDCVEGEFTELAQTNLSMLDGITYDISRDRYYVSAWGDSSIYILDPSFLDPPELLRDELPGPADIYYDETIDSLIVPSMDLGELIYIGFGTTEINAEALNNTDQIAVFPNPAKEKLNVKFPRINNKGTRITIFNEIGELKISKLIDCSKRETSFNVSSLAPGTYYITIKSQDEKYFARFVKK